MLCKVTVLDVREIMEQLGISSDLWKCLSDNDSGAKKSTSAHAEVAGAKPLGMDRS